MSENGSEYQHLVEQVPAIVYRAEVGVSAPWTFISPRVRGILGYSPDEFTSELWAARLHPEDKERVLLDEQAALDEGPGVPQVSEYRMFARDGQAVWIRDEFVLVAREGGPPFYRGVMLDITSRKTAEEALARSEARFRTILETTSEWIWTADPEGTVTYSNPAIETLLGYGPEEIVGLPSLDLLHPDDRARVHSLHSTCAAKKQGWSALTLKWRHKDGSFRYLESNAVPLLDESGELVGWTGADRDVTERRRTQEELKRTQERLKQAEKLEAVGMLAGGAAHNFNNHLAIIQNYARFVLDELEQGDPKREDMEEIIQAAQRSVTIVRQLLTFSREHTTASEEVDLNELLSQLAPLLHRVLGNDIRLSLELDLDLGLAMMNAAQMEETVLKLIHNSHDSFSGVGELRITTTYEFVAGSDQDPRGVSPAEYVCLSVVDTGCGMTRQVQERMFEPFFTTKNPASRAGLGLSTVYGAVRNWDGHIEVASSSGRGTAIKLFFPRTNNASSPPKRARADG